MMIGVISLLLLSCAFRSAEADCYDCLDGVQYCTSNNDKLNWYQRPCAGSCGYRCFNGAMSRICSSFYPAVDNAANVGRTVSYGGDLYFFCSGSLCNSGSIACPGATAPTGATFPTVAPTNPGGPSCLDCTDGAGTCTAGNANLNSNLRPCNGFCGYKCTNGLLTRTCSSYYPTLDNIGSTNRVLQVGNDLFFFCQGVQCNSLTFSCAAAAAAVAATSTNPTFFTNPPTQPGGGGGTGRASQCYDCQDGVGHCSATDPLLLTWYPVVCNGYCGYKCTNGVMTRTCSTYYQKIDSNSIGRVVTYGSDVFFFCYGNLCNAGGYNCPAATAPTGPTIPTAVTLVPTPITGTKICYDCQDGVEYCSAGQANLYWYNRPCNGNCGYKCTNGVMTRTCSSYYPAIDSSSANVGRTITVGNDLFFFCSGAQCNGGAFSCPGATAPTAFPTAPPTIPVTFAPTTSGVVRASQCYVCQDGVGACAAGNTLLFTQTGSCNGYCGYKCGPGGVMNRICSTSFPTVDNAANVNRVVPIGPDLFLLCSGNLCNSGSVACPGSTTSMPSTVFTLPTAFTVPTATAPTGPIGFTCYECPDGTGQCTTGNTNLAWYAVPCNGVCGYKCIGSAVQRVCSAGYTFTNLVMGTPFYSKGVKFQFCTGANCNSGTISCP